MLKWAECWEGDLLLEAFLPEHEKANQSWLIRVSRAGSVLMERRVPLTWPPRFGPDQGDVAALEAEVETLIEAASALPGAGGDYLAAPVEIPEANPYLHAVLATLLEACASATTSLGLTPETVRALVELPQDSSLGDLFPIAITPGRDRRMRRLIALEKIVSTQPELRSKLPQLVAALATEDLDSTQRILGGGRS